MDICSIVNNDNCISYKALILQIPEDAYRYHYVKTKVRVLRHIDGTLSIFHGPRKLEMLPVKLPFQVN